jgi:hypothetical protein
MYTIFNLIKMGISDYYIYKFLDIVKDTGEFMTKSLDVNLIQTRMNKTSNVMKARKEDMLESMNILIDNNIISREDLHCILQYSDRAIKKDKDYGQFLIDVGLYLQAKHRMESHAMDLEMARKYEKK